VQHNTDDYSYPEHLSLPSPTANGLLQAHAIHTDRIHSTLTTASVAIVVAALLAVTVGLAEETLPDFADPAVISATCPVHFDGVLTSC
jgi:hypothetical protein